MKKLFAVLLVIAMVLSLGVTALAATSADTKITVANAPVGYSYRAYPIFTATKGADDKVTYTITPANPWFSTLVNATTAGASNGYSKVAGLEFVPTDGKAVNDASQVFTVKKLATFSAADFAGTLKGATTVWTTLAAYSGSNLFGYFEKLNSSTTPDATVTIENPAAGEGLPEAYYLILSAPDAATFDTGAPQPNAALTTVLNGQNVTIQNKNDMPLDKSVDNTADGTGDDDNEEGVNLGDVLNYKIEAKVPYTKPEQLTYIYRISDKMSNGLTFGNQLTITVPAVGSNQALNYTLIYTPADPDNKIYAPTLTGPGASVFTLVNDPDAELTGNQVRFNANDLTFEISFDVASNESTSLKPYVGQTVTIAYTGTVNEDAVVGILENKAVLAYGEDSTSLTVKDDSTRNYISKILIDKYENGNQLQKLAGAEFVLFRRNPTGLGNDAYGNQQYNREYYALTVVDSTGTVAYTFPEVAFDSEGKIAPTASQKTAMGAAWDTTHDTLATGYKYAVKWIASTAVNYSSGTDLKDATNITHVVTDTNGAAQFGYLEDSTNTSNGGTNTKTDGYYYLLETEAPVDYTKLLDPVQITVDGTAALDPSMTEAQSELALTNIANVANNPGSTLPSTGGVGATLMTIGGVALILAAGAFLVLRRRKEQE